MKSSLVIPEVSLMGSDEFWLVNVEIAELLGFQWWRRRVRSGEGERCWRYECHAPEGMGIPLSFRKGRPSQRPTDPNSIGILPDFCRDLVASAWLREAMRMRGWVVIVKGMPPGFPWRTADNGEAISLQT